MNNKINVSDVLVQNYGSEFDRDCLSRASFLVNMRLFDVRPQYKELILNIIDYMSWTLDLTYNDYGNGTETGVAAPTLGLPFNIIIVKVKFIKKVMINPQIIERSESKIAGKSNCGCCRLKSKIDVSRYEWISVRFFDEKGKLNVEERIDRMNGGLTIQHEIDHTIGFLITDRFLQQGNNISQLEDKKPETKGV